MPQQALLLPAAAPGQGSFGQGVVRPWGWDLMGAPFQPVCLMPAQDLLQSTPSEPGALCRAGRELWPVPAGSGVLGGQAAGRACSSSHIIWLEEEEEDEEEEEEKE